MSEVNVFKTTRNKKHTHIYKEGAIYTSVNNGHKHKVVNGIATKGKHDHQHLITNVAGKKTTNKQLPKDPTRRKLFIESGLGIREFQRLNPIGKKPLSPRKRPLTGKGSIK